MGLLGVGQCQTMTDDQQTVAGPGAPNPGRHRAAGSVGYTFGDSATEARRLRLVQEVFGPPSVSLLKAAVTSEPSLAYDLGCGPGHTARMVAATTGAAAVVGLDRSEAQVARAIGPPAEPSGPVGAGAGAGAGARAGTRPDGGIVRFLPWDVTDLPFPCGPADLLYARLLLAHLPGPVGAARSWATQLNDGGVLVIDEIEWIRTTNPVLRAHLDLVTARVASTGAVMCAGALLGELGAGPELHELVATVVELPVATASAAAMFSLSLEAWGDDAVTAGLCGAGEIAQLRAAMAELTRSPATGEIAWGLHHAALQRRH